MNNPSHYTKLENMYHNHPLNKFYQAKVSIDKKKSVVSLILKPAFHHAASSVHGSVYWKLLDDSAFFAVNSIVETFFVLTASFTIYLTKPVSSGELIAEGKMVNKTGKQFIAESVLFTDSGEEIARGSGVYLKSKIKMTPEMGYK
ncbi:MAG: PaaI family thioesterase [Candidatus Hodarchaeales archaeon]|jgi:uncharacterized protein (TIGR00369 family)